MKAMILSNALDTNGQNARYVEAARKHGQSERILKALAIGNYDPAGVAERFRIAAGKHEVGLQIRSAHRTVAYFEFPQDLIWTRHNQHDIYQIAKQSDVIHLNNSPLAAQKLRLRKPFLLHHHGTLFRNDPDRMLSWARQARAVQAVSTVDLMRPAPDLLHWLPTAYDIDALAKYRRPNTDGTIHIVHAPTNREGKHTALFVKATDELIAEGLPIRVTIVEGRTNAECLEIKGTADIVYDQLLWGYGCNSVEAWGMGIPVVSGADPWTIEQMVRMWGRIPFAEATEETLKETILMLVKSRVIRESYGMAGEEHVRRYHDELPALERLIELYHLAIRTRSPRIPTKGPKPVTFRYRPGRSVWVDDQRVVFDRAGFAEVEDPYAVEQLRRRSAAGIEEVA